MIFFFACKKGKNLVKYGVGNYADETLRHEDKPKKTSVTVTFMAD